jgi:dolichol-phosphate mannosyltransferase
MNLSIIVPCFNEVENVAKLHDEFLPVVKDWILNGENSAEIIFVDDGSRDSTTGKLKEAFNSDEDSSVKYKFLKHQTNLGLGAALRTGFKNSDGDIVVSIDSDGTYKYSEIPALIGCLKPDIDIVTASPYHPKGSVIGVPSSRLVLSRGSSLIYRLLVDWHIYTYTCLFRAYRSTVIKNIQFASDGFLAGTELLVKALLKGYKAEEMPAVLYKRMYGVSKAKIAQTIFSHLKFQGWVILLRMRMLLGQKPEWIN